MSLVAAILIAAPAYSAEDAIPVKIIVVDEDGLHVPTAVVRSTMEQDRHPVNTSTGHWEADRLYLPDGQELVFKKGESIDFEISAPGFDTQPVTYEVRKRRNVVTVTLKKMALEELAPNDDDEEPVISFGRDRPRD